VKDKAFLGASLIAALAASLCCILPIIFAVAGAGIVGASAFFAAWRPYLLGLTFLLLGIGFYFAYRKPERACEPGSACAIPSVNRKGRIGLWIATAFVILFAAFPYYSGPVANFVLGTGSSSRASAASRRTDSDSSRNASINMGTAGGPISLSAPTISRRMEIGT